MSAAASAAGAEAGAGGAAAFCWAAAVLRALSRMVAPDAAGGDENGRSPLPFLGWGVPLAGFFCLPSTWLILCFFWYLLGLSISPSKSQSTFFSLSVANGAAASTPLRSMATSARTASVISSAGTGLDGVKEYPYLAFSAESIASPVRGSRGVSGGPT